MDAENEHRITVAIVDDSDDVRYLLATLMEVDGRFEVVGEAHTVGDALPMVAMTCPQLVLVDLNLDGDDGTTFIRELRKLDDEVRIAVVTASHEVADHAAARKAGADDVHNKVSMTSTMLDDLASLARRRVEAA